MFHCRVADQHKSHLSQVMSPSRLRTKPSTSKQSSLKTSSPEELSFDRNLGHNTVSAQEQKSQEQGAIYNVSVWICLEVGKLNQALEHGHVENKKKHIRSDCSCSRDRPSSPSETQTSILDEDAPLCTRGNGKTTKHSFFRVAVVGSEGSPHIPSPEPLLT